MAHYSWVLIIVYREHIRDSIETEVATQVKREVDIQIQDYIPKSLAQQAVEIKKRISDTRIVLANSSAFCNCSEEDVQPELQ